MAVQKEIYIAGRRIGLGTGVKGSAEISRSTTQTFDGPKNSGLDKVPHTLEISKLVCDTLDDYIELDALMMRMRNEPETITISETIVSPEGERFTVLKHYINCSFGRRVCIPRARCHYRIFIAIGSFTQRLNI